MAPSAFSLTEADLSVLGPLAEHRFLIVPQLALLLGVGDRTAGRRLRRLHDARLLRIEPIFNGQAAAVRIMSGGLRAIGSPLRPPHLNLNEYRHDVGVGWLWLAARAGSFGELTGFISDRRMQAHDAACLAAGQPAKWGIGVGLFGPRGSRRHHYPDLMLQTASGHAVAVELELTSKSAGRMTRIMMSYASDARVDHVLYLAANQRIAQRVTESARRAGIPDRVHVKLLAPDGIAGAGVGGARVASRRTERTADRQGPAR